MADIFVSYARADKERVVPLVAALEGEGFSVWWDPAITPGQEFDDEISAALDAARAVIVVWTPNSVASRWVRGEAREAADRGVLVPVRFENAKLPIDARAMHTTDLDRWGGNAGSSEFKSLMRALGALLAPGKAGTAESPPGGRDPVSIAVLPFVNMSSDPEQEYFSDGLSEELLNQLAQVKALRVIGRTSCFAFKGKNEDLRTIGNKLGAAHILEGSVRKAGKRLRITAQLIECKSGHHLWSQTYDRELDDVFAIQDDVAREVAKALGIALGIVEAIEMKGGTRNVEAYDLYLRGLATSVSTSLESMQRGAAFLRRAVELDPAFALAWLQLATALSFSLTFGAEGREDVRRERDEALERVIALAPDLWAAHAARAAEFSLTRRKWLEADRAFAKAIELGPRPFPEAPLLTAMLSSAGRVNESIPYMRALREADPLRPLVTLQFILTLAGRDAEADAEYARTCEMEPGTPGLSHWFAFAQSMATKDPKGVKDDFAKLIATRSMPPIFGEELLALFDDPNAALAWIEDKVADPSPAIRNVLILFAFFAAYFGALDLALALLRRQFDQPGAGSPLLNIWHPVFARVRKLDGFKAFVRDLGIHDYWRATGKWGDFARPKGDDDFEIIR